ncbi:MAG: hypothetical protein COB85_09850, partial [Bacteroidetes bacterium]
MLNFAQIFPEDTILIRRKPNLQRLIKVRQGRNYILFIVALSLSIIGSTDSAYGQCDSTTPEFIVDLSLYPDSVWSETNTERLDSCCYQESGDPCISFVVTLAPSAGALYFSVESPQPNISSAQFHINCDSTVFSVQDTVCIAGFSPPYTITYCKPGNDKPTYVIAGIGSGDISPPITVSEACSDTLWAEGFVDSTIVWTSIPSDSTLESYLDCPSGCDTVIVTPTGAFPDSIQYKVCGTLEGTGCESGERCDSTWVYFLTSLDVQINPQNPSICFGGSGITLTAAAVGGRPPYTYLWSTGSTTDTIEVLSGNPGIYWVSITDSSGCPSASDTVTVIEFDTVITANAGTDFTICSTDSNISLNGAVTGVSTGSWSWGAGTFTPSSDSLSTTYTPTPGELSSGTVTLLLTTTFNGTCPADSDTIVIQVDTLPILSAGPDLLICLDPSGALLSGATSTTTDIVWTTTGGGSFLPGPNIINPTYIPFAVGVDTLVLTDTNACAVSDSVLLTITPSPTASAGPDTLLCAASPNLPLSGSITVVSTGAWTTTGSGSFTPSNTDLNATYNSSAGDTVAGSVQLILTPTSGCDSIPDTLLITFSYSPTVNAGPDQTVCANNAVTTLAGSISVASGAVWTTSGTGTFADASVLTTTYTPSDADTTAGTITLTLTTTGNGACNPAVNAMIITITDAPTADAGPDQTVCANNAVTTLSGSVTDATGGAWTTSGTGTFADASALSTTYTPSNADTTAGTVTLTLTTTGNGTCNSESDFIIITITDAPTVDAGPDQTVCANNAVTTLSGAVTDATGGAWTTSGTGSFA